MDCSNVLVSVIVPVYNVENYLEKCINSVLEQTHQNFELILIDDGSPDKSGEICDRYAEKDNRIKVIHKENGGLSSARNAGIEISQGDFLLFLDSDDFINIHTLEITVRNCIENNCEVCIFSSFDTPEHDIPFCDDVSNVVKVYKTDYILQNYNIFPSFFNKSACNKLYSKNIFKTLRFPLGLLYEDTAIILQAYYEADQICETDAVMYYYYLSPNSIMRSPFSEKKLDMLKVFQINIDFLKDKNYPHITETFKATYEYCVCRLYAQLCLSSLKNKRDLKNRLRVDRKRIHKENINNKYFTKRMRIFSYLLYYCPFVYLLKKFL
ncbi:MAG: glycosyltransferase family 2 protein [Eubacterium sp.]|nr:glycosyltransferase family 2 protein [Eubacterium sp.]